MTTAKFVQTPVRKGFSVGPLLLIVALIGIIGTAVSLSARTSSKSPGDESARVSSATIMAQAAALKDGFDRMVANSIDVTTITFDTTASTGLFEAGKGWAQKQDAPVSAIPAGSVWKYSKLVKVTGVSGVVNNYAVALEVTRATCEAINKLLFGSTAVVATSTAPGADPTTGWTVTGTQTEGCVANGTTNYYAYKVVAYN